MAAQLDTTDYQPVFGKRLLPQVLDHLSESTSDRLYATILRSSDLSQGFRDITVKQIAQCADTLAYWIHDSFGSSGDFETIGYIGIPDLRSAAFFLAAVKCGYKVSKCLSDRPTSQDQALRFFFLRREIPSAQTFLYSNRLDAEESSLHMKSCQSLTRYNLRSRT